MRNRENFLKKIKQGIPSGLSIKDPSVRQYCEALREIVLQLISDLYEEEALPEMGKRRLEEVARKNKKHNDERDDNDVTINKERYEGEMSVDIKGSTITLKNDSENPSVGSVYSVADSGERQWNDVIDVMPVAGSIIKGFDDNNGGRKTIFLQGDEDISTTSSGRLLYTFGGGGFRSWKQVTDIIGSGDYVKLEYESKKGYTLKLGNEDGEAGFLQYSNIVYTQGGWRVFTKLAENEYNPSKYIDVVNETPPNSGTTIGKFRIVLKNSEKEGSVSDLTINDNVYTKDGWRTFKGSGATYKGVGSIVVTPPNPEQGVVDGTISLKGDDKAPSNNAVYVSTGGGGRGWIGSTEINVVSDVSYDKASKTFKKTVRTLKVFGVDLGTKVEQSVDVFTATPHWKEHETKEQEQ